LTLEGDDRGFNPLILAELGLALLHRLLEGGDTLLRCGCRLLRRHRARGAPACCCPSLGPRPSARRATPHLPLLPWRATSFEWDARSLSYSFLFRISACGPRYFLATSNDTSNASVQVMSTVSPTLTVASAFRSSTRELYFQL